jgi:hypothetical protein
MNTAWCHQAAVEIAGSQAIAARNIDSSRGDVSFRPLYIGDGGARRKFVMSENPMQLSERLIIQQGVLMCPGDVAAGFVENLQAMTGWDSRSNLIKVRFNLERGDAMRFALTLRRMNVDSAVLFPGLDGFARSLRERLPLYVDLSRRMIGSENFKTGSAS